MKTFVKSNNFLNNFLTRVCGNIYCKKKKKKHWNLGFCCQSCFHVDSYIINFTNLRMSFIRRIIFYMFFFRNFGRNQNIGNILTRKPIAHFLCCQNIMLEDKTFSRGHFLDELRSNCFGKRVFSFSRTYPHISTCFQTWSRIPVFNID